MVSHPIDSSNLGLVRGGLAGPPLFVFNAVAVSRDGSAVFVTGGSDGQNSKDYATVAYNVATGARLWASRYNGPENNYDEATSIGVSPDGSRVFVTGRSGFGPYDSNDFATIARDYSSGSATLAEGNQDAVFAAGTVGMMYGNVWEMARVQSLVAELQAADRQMRERYADVLTLIDASPTHQAS